MIRILKWGAGLMASGLCWLGLMNEAHAKGRYDPKTGQFFLSYTYASLPNTSNDAEALVSKEVSRTVELDALVNRFYQVVVLGKPKSMPAEQVEQFLTSFKIR